MRYDAGNYKVKVHLYIKGHNVDAQSCVLITVTSKLLQNKQAILKHYNRIIEITFLGGKVC